MRDSGKVLLLIHWGMVNAGLDVDRIYKTLGYDPRNLPLQKIRTRHELQKYFWMVLEGVTHDHDIGLHLCPHLPTFKAEVMEYLFMSSKSLGQGLRAVLPYSRLISDALEVDYIEASKEACFTLRGTTHDSPQLRHAEICYAYTTVNIIHKVTEGRIRPTRITLCCSRRAPQSDYDAIFGCPVSFNSGYSHIYFDRALMRQKSPHYDSAMFYLHCSYAAKELEKIQQADLTDSVFNYLLESIESGEALDSETLTIDYTAEALDIHPRRLRRSLAEAGTGFRDLIKDARFRFARHKLRYTQITLEEIADKCGFSMPSAFYRAFKEWAGCTPSEYRERYQPDPADNTIQQLPESQSRPVEQAEG